MPPRAERVKPCLWDRLTDEDPQVPEESRAHMMVPPDRYLAAVLRDLLWLFSTRAHPLEMPIPTDSVPRSRARPRTAPPLREQSVTLADFPEVCRSVLRYGVPDLVGVLSAQLSLTQLAKEIEECIRLFEPRINPRTLSVKPVMLDTRMPSKPTPTSICFELKAEVWMEPFPESLQLNTVIDLETGHCELLALTHESKAA
jgi:type VI secretion system protein ImpF